MFPEVIPPAAKPAVTEFTIDRSKWARFNKNGQSMLLNPEGNMCCLGFYAEACGATKGQLAGIFNPGSLREVAPKAVPAWLLSPTRWNSEETIALMRANDGSIVAEAKLEAYITETFAKQGVAVSFVDGVDGAVVA